jgi:uncharacterized membrane protein
MGAIEPEEKGIGTERLNAFSDGVIAIILTIMVLELKLPEAAATGDLWSGFWSPLLPKLGTYLLSFVIVGANWINHHQLLAVVRRVTPEVLWLNLLLLLFLSLIPLATGFLGEHFLLPRAIAFYAGLMALSSAAFGLLRLRLSQMPGHDINHAVFNRGTLVRSFLSTSLCAAAAAMAAFSPVAAYGLLVFVPFMFNIPLLFQRNPAS